MNVQVSNVSSGNTRFCSSWHVAMQCLQRTLNFKYTTHIEVFRLQVRIQCPCCIVDSIVYVSKMQCQQGSGDGPRIYILSHPCVYSSSHSWPRQYLLTQEISFIDRRTKDNQLTMHSQARTIVYGIKALQYSGCDSNSNLNLYLKN